ncbi:10345_t:CDS:2, partial [Racocetra persica]
MNVKNAVNENSSVSINSEDATNVKNAVDENNDMLVNSEDSANVANSEGATNLKNAVNENNNVLVNSEDAANVKNAVNENNDVSVNLEDVTNVKNAVNENNDVLVNSKDVTNVKNTVNENNDVEEQFLCALREDPFVVGNIKDLEDEDLKKFIASLQDAKKQRTFIVLTANAIRKPFFFVLEFISAFLGRVVFYVGMILVLAAIIPSCILLFLLLCMLSSALICIASVAIAIPTSIIWVLSPILKRTGAYKNILKGVFHMSEDQAENWNKWAVAECFAEFKNTCRQKSDENDDEFRKEVNKCIEDFIHKAIMYTEVIEWIQNEENEKNEKELVIDRPIGEGGFGKVYLAEWQKGIRFLETTEDGYKQSRKKDYVALKTLKTLKTSSDRKNFLKE